MSEIIESYNQAEYFVDEIGQPIRVGEINAEVENLLQKFNVSSWSFITAWNPLSVEFSAEENLQRNQKLKEDLTDYRIFEGEGRDSQGLWTPERSFLILGISRSQAKNLGVKYGQRAILFGEKNKPCELVETLFTNGNCEIIRREKTSFLCSRKVSASVVLKCYDWAITQREAGNCVISGFHSQIERDVLHYLLKGNQPIIIALARGLKKQLEPEFTEPLEKGRLLIITPFDEKINRVSRENALIRNKLMIDLADKLTVGFAETGGVTQKLIEKCPAKTEFIR